MSALFGIVATFEQPETMKRAIVALRQAGVEALEAYSPYPLEDLANIVRPSRKPVLPLTIFLAAIFGAVLGYWIQYWDEALSYPINVGGRPYNSWPAFTVSTVELMLLMAVGAGFVAVLGASRLPMLYHPVFNADAFQRASRDQFVLCVEKRDPHFDADALRDMLGRLGAVSIEEVCE